MRLKETTGNSRESGRLRESHETQGDFRRLMRLRDYWVLMRLIETAADSRDSERLR